MAETLTIRTASSTEVVKIAVPGPQGPKGDKGDPGDVAGLPLTTQGDTLYRGASQNERLPIGTSGQVLKVSAGGIPEWGNESGAVTSVNGETGAVVLDAADVGAAPATGIDPTAISGTAVVDSDPRLTDSRNPSSHSSSHALAGSDPLFDQDLNTTDGVTFESVTATDLFGLGAFEVVGASPNRINVSGELGMEFFGTTAASTRTNLGLGNAAVADIGTGSTEVAAGDHGHGNINSSGQIGSTAGLPVVTTTAGAVTTLALGTANQILRVNSGATGVEFADPAASGVSSVSSSASDVLGVSGANITGVDAGSADRLVFWDDSASKLTYLEAGSGLSISGTTLTATASGGSKTYAVFTATDNQPLSTTFATLDTRNSIAVLDFDDATDESAVFVGVIPEGASLGSGLKIRLHWMATTATSGNCVWDVSLERMTTDIDSDSFDTIASATAAANGTSGILTVTEITLTTIDSVTAGDGFRLKVTRDANNGSDSMSGDAELVLAEVRSAA